MEQIDLQKYQHTPIGTILLIALENYPLTHPFFDDVFHTKGVVNVKLTFNDHEVSFLSVINRLVDEYDRLIAQEAKNLLIQKYQNLQEQLNQIIKEKLSDLS